MLNNILNIGTRKGQRHAVRMTNLFIVIGLPLLILNVFVQALEFNITATEFWLINGIVILAYCATLLLNWLNQNELARAWMITVFVLDITLASTRWFGIESLIFFHLVILYPVAFLLWQNKPSIRNALLALISVAFFAVFYWPSEPMYPSNIEQRHSSMALVFINCAILLSLVAKLFSVDTQRAHNHLAKQARIDPLTNILNRRELERQLEQACSSVASMAVMLFDIDKFKAINDQHGHHAGDEALKHVVATIQEVLPEELMFARFGGDEFCILWPNCKRPQAQYLALQLVQHVASKPWQHQQHRHRQRMTISMGLAFDTQSQHLSKLLIEADHAMYAAKGKGRNTFVAAWIKPKHSVPA
ncbi:GGDEF domain-containing protein [Agarivorans sp. TSD2052]|uniref:GGDEF domain-containing protein n=1 Tax=Agarivorans sp. TSD2052 TaxID=2937286 RepID=UPI0020104A51|nr:GGDEF domain-containing protein [Agarivorans sp. TSD2052]UPW18514.1 GGDEF domain-containing protein [Agarivorans sp. TSD2052]